MPDRGAGPTPAELLVDHARVERPPGPARGLARSRAAHALLLVAVCLAIFLPGVGSGGLRDSEGHRAVPAWTLLEEGAAGSPIVNRMFGVDYVRKPPGMTWAIAASSRLLGPGEGAARAVSVLAGTLSVLLTFAMATRWFGPPWGLAAGLAHAVTPQFWLWARVAEIEALHTLGVQACVLLLLELLLRPGGRARSWGHTLRWGVLLGGALTLALLVKGPAGLPCVAGALLASGLVSRSLSPALHPGLWIALGMAALGVAPVYLGTVEHLARTGAPFVWQDVREFMWSVDRAGAIAALAPAALAAAFPASLALLFPFGRDAREEARSGPGAGPHAAALAVAWSCLLALGVFAAAGVTNPRYALPATAALPVLVAYVARGASRDFTLVRTHIARATLSPRAWAVFTAVMLVALFGWYEPSRRAKSGRDAGAALAPLLPDGASVYANDLIEARPEILWQARADARRDGRRVRVVWNVPGTLRGALPPPGDYLALRTDDASREARVYLAGPARQRLDVLHEGRVHDYTFVLARVRAAPTGSP